MKRTSATPTRGARHLGNIAPRVGRDLRCAPGRGRVLDDAAAMRLWRREYAPGFAPKV